MFDIRSVIEKVIRERLGSRHVIEVLLSQDDDFDDDHVLWVTVVVSDANSDLDNDKILGLVRHIQPKLADGGVTAFPVISFMSQQEQREAA